MKCYASRYPGVCLTLLLILAAVSVQAGTELDLYRSFAGPVNFCGTGGTLRTDSNAGDACSVTDHGSAMLSDLPAGATVEAACLYWAGSYSNYAGSTRTTPDWDITFEGNPLFADRQFIETFNYLGTTYDFFSGFCDVTAIVAANGNGLYDFADLDVNTATPHCWVQVVLSGWALIVVYSHPDETNRVVNVYDGFEYYQRAEVVVVADNFRIADSNIDGKVCHVTWEGDEGNSHVNNGFTESLMFNNHDLVDVYNPADNQFNSTINVLGSTTSYGVDFDIYDVTPWLNAGDTSAVSTYSSGQDLVLLSAEVISVTNAPTTDLQLTKTHVGDFIILENGDFELTVSNSGPGDETALITVTDNLPAGVDFIGAVGGGWTVDASAAPQIVCTHSGPLPAGQSLPPITLTVKPDGSAMGTLSNTATVSSPTFDFQPGNNTAVDNFEVVEPSEALFAEKSVMTYEDPINGLTAPKAIPGATAEYVVEVWNRLRRRIDRNTVVFVDAVPSGTVLYVGDLAGAGSGPVGFSNGVVSSVLSYRFLGLADTTDDLQFSNNGGIDFNYSPVGDIDGFDASVTHLRVTPRGRFRGLTNAGAPSFLLRFRVRVD